MTERSSFWPVASGSIRANIREIPLLGSNSKFRFSLINPNVANELRTASVFNPPGPTRPVSAHF